MSNFTFTADSITVAGKTFRARYLILPAGAVIALVTVPGVEEVQRVRFNQDHPDHAAALAAAQAAEVATEAEPAAETVQETTTEAPAQDAPAAETNSTFPGWTGELHMGKEKAQRIEAAKEIPAGQIIIDRERKSAQVESYYKKKQKHIYEHTTTLQKCTCGDFIRYQMPCKHMYRLAHDLGLLDEDWNAAEAPAPAEERETIPEGYTATTTAAGHIIAVQRNEYAAEAERAAEAPAQAEPAAEMVQETTTEAPAQETAPAPAPAKDFIGQTITGNGWRIFFDAETSRTRVIFDAAPTAAAAAALEKAGFYFSKAMNSYNKKLTCKAHRAAVALSGELRALYA